MITLITGGVRSGKSSFAEGMFSGKEDVVYIATAVVEDEEMKERVRLHRLRRPDIWRTFEGYKGLKYAVGDEKNYLLDCVTNLISNIMFERTAGLEYIDDIAKKDVEDAVIDELNRLTEEVRKKEGNLVLVTNEVGYSIVPENNVARAFRDIQGRVNVRLGSLCDEVYLVVCGIPIKIK
ncbi:bifunctional adenosylcobinamide kinase/adenosylcobinamide-phosphate guanylyltransferase [Thermobrachium celere]|uniref:Adenosylcobinamide kinase n=1 Tax=Thermobrachium celere DSM 8682 TaxID=941824 RepID=R7RM80_9CLOT|nr:bifunctional adenosylcobinamide kinase/adenosylcobinamide-phosphate guanylyltransferase [Thermobrachium celere]CDF57277.1 Adenosylcobinamide-phosphate guanylyltransferase [Thermobrachium celere DSM 8682]